ncbi:MAG TPA: hypothetical protein VN828_03690 [Acidobacteriaceae bacterium]|nr:hypothetical protein [Acidobacteriaceae bacterium]
MNRDELRYSFWRIALRYAVFFAVLFFISWCVGQCQTTQITASNIDSFGGRPVTGKFCVTPTNLSGQPINISTPSGNQLSPAFPLCFPVTSGALSASAIVPDTSLTQPVNACLKATIYDSTGEQVGGTYPCLQPHGTTWDFDSYVPGTLPSIPTLTGGSNENLSYSATPTFSISTSSSRISLSGSISTFTLAAGTDGQQKCLEFVHDGTQNVYTVTPPANVFGFMHSVGLKRAQQCFTYYTVDALWVANNPGVVQ